MYVRCVVYLIYMWSRKLITMCTARGIEERLQKVRLYKIIENPHHPYQSLNIEVFGLKLSELKVKGKVYLKLASNKSYSSCKVR